jgi:purine-cytosine permease-like protein
MFVEYADPLRSNEENHVGGVLVAMLRPAGGFGKFVAVLLSLSVVGNIAATFYSVSLNFQVLFPPFGRWPRYVFALLTTAIVIPLAIVAAGHFYDALVNFLGSKFHLFTVEIGIIS